MKFGIAGTLLTLASAAPYGLDGYAGPGPYALGGPNKGSPIILPSKGFSGPPPPMAPPMPLMPPPISTGPDVIHLSPVLDHQVVVLQGKHDAGQQEEYVMQKARPPPPSLVQMMPPPESPYVPPTLVQMPQPAKYPDIIHAMVGQVPAAPSILPTKTSRIANPSWRPVAVLAGPTKGQFTRVGRIPSKQGPSLPHLPVSIRPVHKGEM